MSSFDWKKNIEDSTDHNCHNHRNIFCTKSGKRKTTKSLDTMDIMKLAGGICGGVLVKDYAVHKKWIDEWCNKNFMAR